MVVFPVEIEECLIKHDSVKEVVVFGVQRNQFEHAVCAWVKLKQDKTATADDLKQHCSSHFDSYKVPSYIKFVDEFLVNKLNKYLRKDMEKIYANELNLYSE
jgi:fatty-acyl-CoA synthase